MSKGKRLQGLVSGGEQWLMQRILVYAKERDYTKYTSTLEEAWRLSIAGLSRQLVTALEAQQDIPELGPDEDYTKDPTASFGILESQRHRARGIPLDMFLGLMKYYVQTYHDLVDDAAFEPEYAAWCHLFVQRFFDRIELGFCTEWSGIDHEAGLRELQAANRDMTNEKNRYLTVFESLPTAVFLLDAQNQVVNHNQVATQLFGEPGSPGAFYYAAAPAREPLPWLAQELRAFLESGEPEAVFEKALDTRLGARDFEVKLKRMLDVSDKFSGITVILNDVTEREEAQSALAAHVQELEKALEEIETLQGLLPICSYCKRIRDDQNYWNQIESYVASHSKAKFSHGVCPECYERHIEPLLHKT